MHRTIGDSYGMEAGKRIFRQENLPSYEATQVTYDTMNALQEEIARAIEGAGIALNAPNEPISAMTQLDAAIRARVAAEAALRNANDRVANGDLARDQLNRLNEQTGLATVLATMRGISSLRANGFQMWVFPPAPYLNVFISTGSTRAANGDAFIYNGPEPPHLVKNINAVWAVGAGKGGRAGALTNNTWYHLFVIRNNTGPYIVDAGFDTDINATNLLAASGYTFYKRIGSVYYVDSVTGILPFVSQGDTVLWKPPVSENNGLPITIEPKPAVTTIPLTVPPVPVTALLNCKGIHSTHNWRINMWDGIMGPEYNPAYSRGATVVGVAEQQQAIEMHLLTNDGNVYATENLALSPSSLTIGTRGYIDERQDF